ncbi:MAG: MFS transporter, partial [Chloroflexota bacterium]|nr:MFS transporter [Chloroflexota bacterium]
MIQNDVLEKRLGLNTMFYYGVASFGAPLVFSFFAALLPVFYQDYLGLSARWIGIASAIYAVWNAINDPLFGHITDNTYSKLGHRTPCLRFTARFLCLTFILVWFAPQGAGEVRLFWWMLITMLLYDTCYTIVGLILAGVGLSGKQTITYDLLVQVIDDDEVRTGAGREGAFYGANALLIKPAQPLSLFLTVFILERSGFITRTMNNGEIFLSQAGSALFAIRTIVGLIPGLSLLISAEIFLFPLKGEQLAKFKDTILSMHADKSP